MNIKSLKLIWSTFNIKEKKQSTILFFAICILALLQALGVVSILPFMYVLTNPEITETNRIFATVKNILGIKSEQTFLLFLAFFSFITLLVANIFSLLVMYLGEVFYSSYGYRISHRLFENYLKDKYEIPGATHHHEKKQTSGDTGVHIECASSDSGAVAVSNREYEQRLQDDMSEIKLLSNDYLPLFLDEFDKLMSE